MALHLRVGEQAEQLVYKQAKQKGFIVLVRNFRCKLGEIDLILTDTSEIIFTEIRCRREHATVTSAQSVDEHKQRKIIRTAEYFLSLHQAYANMDCRFDVVEVKWKGMHFARQWKTDWQVDAFRLN